MFTNSAPSVTNEMWVSKSARIGEMKSNTKTPIISFKKETRSLVIKGAFNEMHFESFQKTLPILLEDYFEKENKLTCYFHIKDLNSPTMRLVMGAFKTLSKFNHGVNCVNINWFSNWYEQDLQETGFELGELFDLHTNVIPV